MMGCFSTGGGMTSPKIATFHDGLVLKWQGTKGTTATTAMWKLIHGGQQSRSHRHGGRQSAGVQLRTRRRFGMLSYNSNLPENIYNSEFKGALDNLGLDFLLKKNADLLVFVSTGSTHSLSLSERGCSCHTSEGQRVQKGLLEIGNHYPTTSWPNKAYLVSNCPWCLCRAFHTWRLLIWSLSWWQKSGASRPVALRNFDLKRLGKMISLISL